MMEYLRIGGEKGEESLLNWLISEQERFVRIRILNYINHLDPEQLQSQMNIPSKKLKTARATSSFLYGMNLVINNSDVADVGKLLMEGQKEFASL
jgi:hypothetical protein